MSSKVGGTSSLVRDLFGDVIRTIPDSTQIKLVASAIIVDKNGCVLMLQRSKNHKSFRGLWQLPEGKLEAREVAREAMEREVEEETGLVVKNSVPLTVTQIMTKTNGISYLIVRVIFLVACEGLLQLSDEHVKAKWVSEVEAKKLKTVVGTKQIITDFWREKQNVHSFTHSIVGKTLKMPTYQSYLQKGLWKQ